MSDLQALKKKIFFDMLDLAGRVFIHVQCDDNVVIGERGFLPEEKKRGIILVLNKNMHFTWDDSGISAELMFGSSVQKCHIPSHAIVSLVSPELNAQFSVMPKQQETEMAQTTKHKRTSKKVRPDRGEKVIKVDFNKKNP